MRLLEAIVTANERAVSGGGRPEPLAAELADALPLVALTCIDARLNKLIPEMLGVPEEKFIWLRNAGNIITGPLSSTMRSLALACAVKGGKEVAVIGHSDCQVAKGSTLQLLDSFAKLGVERAKLPENLNEFFGVFASERQNVIKGCDIVRRSPLLGPKIPVHGLLLDVSSGRLEWIVNGYETLSAPQTAPASDFTQSLKAGLDQAETVVGNLKEFTLGEMKFPETKIGEIASQAEQIIQQVEKIAAAHPQAATPKELVVEAAKDFARHIIQTGLYKVVGDDKKVYGPIRGEKLLQWLAEDRIDGKTLVQTEGSSEWAPLEKLGELLKRAPVPLPPPLQPNMTFKVRRPRR
jgi:carbonic anhydrase